MKSENTAIIKEFELFINNREFPCVAAKAALERQQIRCMVAGHMACPKDDDAIIKFLYHFVADYRNSSVAFHSASIIFKGPEMYNEEMFDTLLWQRLQSLSDLDAKTNSYDTRVDIDPNSSKFSFSLKEEAFFVIGLHPVSSRPARQFKYPVLVFNPHLQFEQLRELNRYGKMKDIVRKRDVAYSGSVNPMLEDFGTSSEVYQYSGLKYDDTWKCPLKLSHKQHENHSTP